jgi:hypothetical protein
MGTPAVRTLAALQQATQRCVYRQASRMPQRRLALPPHLARQLVVGQDDLFDLRHAAPRGREGSCEGFATQQCIVKYIASFPGGGGPAADRPATRVLVSPCSTPSYIVTYPSGCCRTGLWRSGR